MKERLFIEEEEEKRLRELIEEVLDSFEFARGLEKVDEEELLMAVSSRLARPLREKREFIRGLLEEELRKRKEGQKDRKRQGNKVKTKGTW